MNKLIRKLPQKHQELLSIYIAFAVIILVNLFLDKNLLKPDRIAVILMSMVPLVLAAMSQTMVILTGGIDLSIGNVVAMMACITATTMHMGVAASVGIVLFSGLTVGLVNGLLVTYGRIPAIIVTLAMQFFWHGVALSIMPRPGGMVDQVFFYWINGGKNTWAGLVFIVVSLLVWKFIKTSRLGVAIYATGDNAAAAYANGIKTNFARVGAYVIGGVFAAVAGLALAGITGSGDPNIGVTYTMNSIAATIIGGAAFTGGQGQMRGTIMGAVFVTMLMSVLFFSGLSSFYQYLLQGAILIAAVSLKAFEHKRKEDSEYA